MALLLLAVRPGVGGSLFDLPEVKVTPSPMHAARVPLPSATKPLDVAAAPHGPEVALLLTDSTGAGVLTLWKIGDAGLRELSRPPQGPWRAGSPGILKARNCSWPAGRALNG